MSTTFSFSPSETIFVPGGFNVGQTIEQVILISDVDGVVRQSTESKADNRVIKSIKTLLKKNISVSFISGTPIDTDRNLEIWRRGNLPLTQVFNQEFAQEISENRVSIFGVSGGHKMKEDGSFDVVDTYLPEHSWHFGKLLIQAFLQEVLAYGTASHIDAARAIQKELENLACQNFSSSHTVLEFYEVVKKIRDHIDPKFRLITNDSLVESQTSHPPWGLSLSSSWLQEEISSDAILSTLPHEHKQIAMGLAHRDNQKFNYLHISKTNKGLTTKRLLEEKLQSFQKALIITIGDTQLDFPMHKCAHIAFHVGLEKVWRDNFLPNCMMIRGAAGEDQQHVEGMLKVLECIKDGIGKSFDEFKYIPRQDSNGQWNLYSLREINQLN